MYEISGELLPYYSEIDPKKRLIILDSFPEGEAVNYLRELYNNRYSDHENKGRKNVDWWLWRCICLQMLFSRGGLFKKFRAREIDTITDELLMNDTSNTALLYHEYRNVARRYLSTCRSSDYASSFMGFKKASDEEKIIRACSDIWQMSRGIAKRARVEEKMRLWCEAFHDELIEYDTVCSDEYDRLDRKQ